MRNVNKNNGIENTRSLSIRLYPTHEHMMVFTAPYQENIHAVTVVAWTLNVDFLLEDVGTNDFSCALPYTVGNQALHDVHTIFKQSLIFHVLPVLTKPTAQWNIQNWHVTDCLLALPLYNKGKTKQTSVAYDGLYAFMYPRYAESTMEHETKKKEPSLQALVPSS